MIWIVIGALILFVMLNIPVGFAMIGASLIYFFMKPGLPYDIIFQRLVSGVESFPLLAIPFFILAGNLMTYGGVGKRLMNFAEIFTGHLVGGLAQVNVLLSALMGGMSGSSNADAAMQSTLLVPEMVKKGYSPAFCAAVTSATAALTAIIPPGISLILYGFIANVSISRMFLAAIIPGLLLTASLMVLVGIISKKREYKPSRSKRATLKELYLATKETIWALILPIIILGGIRFGIYTPTEAGSVAVMYVAFIGVVIYRELNARLIIEAIKVSLHQTAMIMLIIAAAAVFGWVLGWEQIPQKFAIFLTSITESQIGLLLIINLGLLIAGMFIESAAVLLILGPLLVPAIVALGIDPVHFGILMVINVTVGGMTPPLGTTMYTCCSIIRVSIPAFTREIIPFVITIYIVLIVLTILPNIILYLPNLL